MTFSIAAFDPTTNRYGVATASYPAETGRSVPWTRAGVGCVATQADGQVVFGPVGLDLLEAGLSASETIETLLHNDAGAHQRQLIVIDRVGRSAVFTGEECIEHAGHLTSRYFACAGNLLETAAVIPVMASAYERSSEKCVANRLLAALHAGNSAGGDQRGIRSAGLHVSASSDFDAINIVIDEDADPLRHLAEALGKLDPEFVAAGHHHALRNGQSRRRP